jgi:hypothetical protein
MSRILTITFSALLLAAPALADTVPQGATVLQHQPTGAGKPDAVSCYQTVATGSHTRNLQCARNSDWARLDEWQRLNRSAALGNGQPTSTLGPGGPFAINGH